jgi:hypothetical protein
MGLLPIFRVRNIFSCYDIYPVIALFHSIGDHKIDSVGSNLKDLQESDGAGKP